jgi:hypothetical protein
VSFRFDRCALRRSHRTHCASFREGTRSSSNGPAERSGNEKEDPRCSDLQGSHLETRKPQARHCRPRGDDERKPGRRGRQGVESRSGAVAFAPFPLSAHRTGRADFRHPALGQELTLSPTESSWFERPSGPVPARRAGTDREVVILPDSTACVTPEATDGADGEPAGSEAHHASRRATPGKRTGTS